MTRHACSFPHVLGYARISAERSDDAKTASAESDTDRDDEIAEMARLEFEPWDKDECPLPTNQEWIDGINPYLVSLRIAFATLCQTKTQLIGVVESLSDTSALDELMTSIEDVEKLMDGYGRLAKAASARLMVAMSVLAQRESEAPQ